MRPFRLSKAIAHLWPFFILPYVEHDEWVRRIVAILYFVLMINSRHLMRIATWVANRISNQQST